MNTPPTTASSSKLHHSTHHNTPKPHSESTPTMANIPPCPIKRAEIIEALRKNQPCTANELAELTGDCITSVRVRLASMVRDGIIQSKEAPRPHQNLLYSLPGWMEDEAPVAGIVAGPRQYVTGSGTYTGPNWGQSACRPGAMDHLKHPSRRGDVLVPHTGQMVSMVGVGE